MASIHPITGSCRPSRVQQADVPFDLDDAVGDAEPTLEIGSAAAGLIRGIAGEDEAATT